MTYFANACRFNVYLKYSLIDFRMHSPQFETFSNDYSRCVPYCHIGQSLKTKQTENINNKKESFRAHTKMAAAFKSLNGRLVQRILSSTTVSMRVRQNTESLVQHFFKRGYFAIVSKLKPDSA